MTVTFLELLPTLPESSAQRTTNLVPCELKLTPAIIEPLTGLEATGQCIIPNTTLLSTSRGGKAQLCPRRHPLHHVRPAPGSPDNAA